MTARELRAKYVEFFQSKGHLAHPSGSLIPFDVTGRLDESLLFNGAGMVQFKPYFRGAAKPPAGRLVTIQKCVRTGDIETVGDLTHLTFFEMLGNFSFGDYFKKEAIAFSWEFLFDKKWLGLDPAKVCSTVFEEDDEAFDEWSKHWSKAGFDPNAKIFRLGEETNYWPAGAFSSGPPGPCGPNSEMFYWTPADEPPPTAPYTRDDYLRDEAAGKWLEIWNDVFIQYEWKGKLRNPERPADGYEKEGLAPLPFQSVDTGMGVERTITALNSKKSVYDNDLFEPLFAKLQELSGKKYGGTESTEDRAFRIIADHIRNACFCIADGILPSNNGRGYVLRRLIRRAVLKGDRNLGLKNLFCSQLFDPILHMLGHSYPELGERKEAVVKTLDSEEELFRRTLRQGVTHFEEIRKQSGKEIPGDQAFKLFDTFGLPLELTQELAEEAGITVDEHGYEVAMKEAQERSRKAGGMATVYGGVGEGGIPNDLPATEFLGYKQMEGEGKVLWAGKSEGGETLIVLDQTPFYAESGGQTSDVGFLNVAGETLEVIGLRKIGGVFVHVARGDAEPGGLIGKTAEAKVDHHRRSAIRRNHTATHLLHAALRDTLGKHVTQAGSYVGPDRLRFDFTHGKALSPEELAAVERIVNEQALRNTKVVTHEDMAIDEARKRGAMALFGEKYGDKVRMVEIGEFSRELCGGTHVGATGEIGLIKVVSEASAASGVRRIEALTGEGAYGWVKEEEANLHQASTLLRSSPRDIAQAIEKLQDNLKELQKKLEKARTEGASAQTVQTIELGAIEYSLQKLTDADAREAGLVADRLADGQPTRVVLVAAVQGDKVALVAKAGDQAVKHGAHAGNLVKAVAQAMGGGGGGRPDFATAGAKQPEKLDEALEAAEQLLRSL